MRNIICKLKRGINHYITILYALLIEKQYKSHGTRVKYMFFKKSCSDTLIVSFPACSARKAKYNYLRTLSQFNCSKLFLLDDFSDNKFGCYFAEDNVEKCTIELLNYIIKKCDSNLKHILLIGSSKGGYSALNFSLEIPNSIAIIGAPQYYLGSYLNRPFFDTNLRFIIKDITEYSISKLDKRLKSKIYNSVIKPKCVYFHYSNIEHTYEEHVKDMIYDLKHSDIIVYEDVKDYNDHDGLSEFFPPFLINSIKHILKER